jgi:hypothetical protein
MTDIQMYFDQPFENHAAAPQFQAAAYDTFDTTMLMQVRFAGVRVAPCPRVALFQRVGLMLIPFRRQNSFETDLPLSPYSTSPHSPASSSSDYDSSDAGSQSQGLTYVVD